MADFNLTLRHTSKQLDTEQPDFAVQLQSAIEEEREAALRAQAEEHKEELTAVQNEVETLKEKIVGEIVRVEALSAGEDYDTEAERDFFKGLSADRLMQHYRRKVVEKRENLSLNTATKEGTKQRPEDDVYEGLQ